MDITQHQRFLLIRALRLTHRNRALADDLVQMTNIKVLSMEVPDKCDEHKWLAVIMKNIYIDWLRKEATSAKYDYAPTQQETSFDVNAAIDAYRALGQLSPLYRESIINDVLGYGSYELSKLHNKSAATYRTRFMKARLKAQEYFS